MYKAFYFFLLSLLILSCEEDHTQPPGSTVTESLFYSSRPLPNGAWQIYKKNLEDEQVDAITNDSNYNYWWVTASPDKKQLLLLRSPVYSPRDQFDYANCEMIKCDIDGKNPEVIIEDNQYDWFAFGNPHWHPNGDRILMIAQKSNTTTPFHTYTVDTDGNNPELLVDQYSIDANWNREGNKITFIGIDAGGFVDATSFEVFIADYNYSSNSISSVMQLTADDTRNHDPCFSPDGRHIAFSASDAKLTNADLISIKTTGSNRITLIDDDGIHGGPINWSRDDKIYHHSIYFGRTNFIVGAFNTNTNNRENLLESTSTGYISPYYID